MTLTEFSRDVVPIIQTILTSVGLGSLVLVWWQIKQATLWNRFNQNTVITSKPSTESEAKTVAAFKAHGIDFDDVRYNHKLSESEAQSLLDDKNATNAIKLYLNEFEEMCAAIRVGAVDPDFAYALKYLQVTRLYRNLVSYIDAVRKKFNDTDIYVEFQKVAELWEDRLKTENKTQEALEYKLDEQRKRDEKKRQDILKKRGKLQKKV